MTAKDPRTDSDSRRDALLKEYGEVAQNFRLLTDIRFKLLALLPIAAAVTTALRGTGDAEPSTAMATLALSLFGLIVTGGLMSYNARNNQLYNELVGRAAAIERELGLPDGAFANRPNDWFSLRLCKHTWPLEHGRSIALIYGASTALWLFGIIYSGAQLQAVDQPPDGWVLAAGLALSLALTGLAGWWITKQRNAREKEMRIAAAATTRMYARDRLTPKDEDLFYALCAGLLSSKTGASKAFHTLCNGLNTKTLFSESDECLVACSKLSKSQSQDTARARGRFYRAHTRTYLPPTDQHAEPEDQEAKFTESSYVVALITDLPPRWVRDCATGRRKAVVLPGLVGERLTPMSPGRPKPPT